MFIEEVIKILEQEPCEDAVSRQAVLNAIHEANMNAYDEQSLVRDLTQAVNELPYVKQEPKTGHWFVDERPESDREVICSNCEQPIFKYHKLDFDYRPKFCPNCGAKMVEPQERSDKG